MKQNLLIKHNFISRKGSATVMALIFLLFFVVAGAGWAGMMAAENKTAIADEGAQQASYAAEAGLKRAMMELRAGNTTNWDWLADNAKISATDNLRLVTTGAKAASDSTDARYGVYITYTVPSDATPKVVKTAGISTSKTVQAKYTIYAVGYYRGTVKAAKEIVSIAQ